MMLVLPFVLEAILSSIIPSEADIINSIRGTVSSQGSYTLSPTNYGTYTLPYYIVNGTQDNTFLLSYLSNVYAAPSRSGIGLQRIYTDNTSMMVTANVVNDYVFNLRKADLKNLVFNYYIGASLILMAPNKLNGVIHYSSLAFHSSANMLNEVDNMILAVATNQQGLTITTINSPMATNNTLTNGKNDFLSVLGCLDTMPVTLLNFVNALIVALITSFLVMHVARERTNGSKQLQLMSGIHYTTYWIANYLFDLLIVLVNVSILVIILKIVDSSKSNATNYEIDAIAGNSTLGYIYILFLFSGFAWCTWAYIWSFHFSSDTIGFVVLLILLGFVAFLDMIFVFAELILIGSNNNKRNGLSNLITGFRFLLALIFPNVTVKRGFYDLKIRSNNYCIDQINDVLDRNFFFVNGLIVSYEFGSL